VPGESAPISTIPSTSAEPRIVTSELPYDALVESSARLVQGDALDVARGIAREGRKGQVDLVYVDPPFASQTTYVHEARLDGPADGRVIRTQAYDDRWRVPHARAKRESGRNEDVPHARANRSGRVQQSCTSPRRTTERSAVQRESGRKDNAGLGGYLEMLAPRLEALAGLLSAQGTIWVHVDWRASYLVRLILDEILGRDAFKNEIVWRRAPNLGRQAASHQFGRTLDTIVVYGGAAAKLTPPMRLEPISPGAVRWDEQGRPFTCAPRGDYTDVSMRRLAAVGRVHRTATGKTYVKYFLVKNSEGVWCRERRVDALWTDVPPLRHARTGERTGFPTQKPRALLDRIIACASPRGGLVVDLFAGSGTTAESAHALGRRFIVGDESPLAVATARARLLRAGVPLVMQRCGTAGGSPEGEEARVAVERHGQQVRIALLEPREPLAWAIDAAWDPRNPFRVSWHSERTPGARAVRAALAEATLERAPGPVAVRIWYDDGRVATRIVEGA
jgi:DNA modification methylase